MLASIAAAAGTTTHRCTTSRPHSTRIVVLAMDKGLVPGGRFPDGIRTNENLGRNAQSVVQLSNHVNGQGSTPIQHLGRASAAPEIAFQVSPRQTATLHVVKQRFDRIGWIDRFVLGLVVFNQRREDLQSVAVGCPRLRVEEPLDFLKRLAMVSASFDWANAHESGAQWLLGVGVAFPELAERAPSDNPHPRSV